MPSHDRIGRKILNALIVGSMSISLLGTLWISDDFDPYRFYLFAYGGVPFLTLYFALEWFYPAWQQQFTKTRLVMFTLFVTASLAGIVPLLNAVSTTEEAVVKRDFGEEQFSSTNRHYRRGGLGGLYRTRW